MRCASVWRRIFWVLIKTNKPELQETNRFIQKWMFILAHMPPCCKHSSACAACVLSFLLLLICALSSSAALFSLTLIRTSLFPVAEPCQNSASKPDGEEVQGWIQSTTYKQPWTQARSVLLDVEQKDTQCIQQRVHNKTAGETIINVLAAKFNNSLHAFLIRVYLHRLSGLAFQLKENATFCCVNVT